MKRQLKIKDICQNASSSLKQKDVEGKNGTYPVYGASGLISKIDTYHQDKEYIAIVKDGSGIGRVSFMPAKSSIIGTMQYILPRTGFDIKYIGYCLKSLNLAEYKQGATIPHIYFKEYGERLVNVTDSIPEQQSIVAHLDSAFAKIDALKANAQKLLENAKDLFQNALKDAMTPKEGWEEKKIVDIVDEGTNISYGIVQPGDGVSQGVAVVRPVDIGVKYVDDISNLKKTTKEISDSYKRTLLNGKEILMCVRGTTGVVSLTTDKLINCNVTRGLVPFKIKDDILRLYVYYWFLGPIAKKFIEDNTKGVALKQINIADVKVIPVSLPSLDVQKSIVEKLDAISSRCRQLEENYTKTIALCDDMKQALLRETFE